MDLCKDDNCVRVSCGPNNIPSLFIGFSYRHSINALSFSHDGEYLAIANAGMYIDIVRPLLTAIHLLKLTIS